MADMHGDSIAVAAATVVLVGAVVVAAALGVHYLRRGRL